MPACPVPANVDRCPPIQVYQVGGTTYIGYLFCDKGNSQQVLAVYQFCNGVPAGAPTFYDPSTGAVYTPVGSVGICSESDFEQTVFCDTAISPPKPFISRVVFTDDNDIVADLTGTFELDAVTPYTPVGPVTVCGGDTVDTELVGPLCERDTTNAIIGQFWHRIQFRGTVMVSATLAGFKMTAPQTWVDPYVIAATSTTGSCASTKNCKTCR